MFEENKFVKDLTRELLNVKSLSRGQFKKASVIVYKEKKIAKT